MATTSTSASLSTDNKYIKYRIQVIENSVDNINCILKLYLQKRTSNKQWWGNLLEWVSSIGLQWILSGNQVIIAGDTILTSLKGNRKFGNELVECWEILLDLRFKVYCTNRH